MVLYSLPSTIPVDGCQMIIDSFLDEVSYLRYPPGLTKLENEPFWSVFLQWNVVNGNIKPTVLRALFHRCERNKVKPRNVVVAVPVGDPEIVLV